MAIYLLKFLGRKDHPLDITVFEASDTAGRGMPYREGINADYMLCNAFSREIPELTGSFHGWLKGRPARELTEWELSPHDISPRAFYPRVLLGEYLQSEFERLCIDASEAGHSINVLTGCRVIDVVPGSDGTTIRAALGGGTREMAMDLVVIATGHQWPDQPALGGVRLVSPWPYDNVTELPPGEIGILGSSLSAVDVVVALGHAHGRFDEEGATVSWTTSPGSEGLHVTMVSHMGIMPEGDFYYPFPYRPLRHITDEGVRAEVEKGPAGLLRRVFDLLIREIEENDPQYMRNLGSEARSIPGFARGYFSHRREIGGLAAVREGFAEVRASMHRRETIEHRYALLRGHEKFDLALRYLDEADREEFTEHLMPVFADCYAAVPHLSLARILAMEAAGVLDLRAAGHDAEFRQTDDAGVEVTLEGGSLRFDAMIDARGQPPAGIHALPFPSLTAMLPSHAAPLEAPFRLALSAEDAAPIYCLAIPQLLERYPFSQGLANCAELAGIVAADVSAACETGGLAFFDPAPTAGRPAEQR